MSQQPSSVSDDYVPYDEVFRVHPSNSEYGVINLRSIVHFLVASDLCTRLESWLRNPQNATQFVIHLGGQYRLGDPGTSRNDLRGQQVLTALVVQAMGGRNSNLCEYY